MAGFSGTSNTSVAPRATGAFCCLPLLPCPPRALHQTVNSLRPLSVIAPACRSKEGVLRNLEPQTNNPGAATACTPTVEVTVMQNVNANNATYISEDLERQRRYVAEFEKRGNDFPLIATE